MGGTREAEARTTQPEFAGGSAARELITQSGGTQALFQEAMRAEGAVYTLAFDVVDPGVPYECVATVKASDRGNPIVRQFNVIKGTSISLPGRVFDVRITDTTPALLPLTGESPVDTPGAGTGYWVTCVIEPYPRGNESLDPTLYGGSVQLLSDDSITVNIPENCGVVSLEVVAQSQAAVPGTPNVSVTYTTSAGGVFKQYNPVLFPGFIPIPPGATQVTIDNNDAANQVIVTITWGIDG